MKLSFLLVCLFLAGLAAPAPARAQQEQEKENFDWLMPAMGALDRGDYAQAIDSLRPLAADGTIEAQFTLGTILETAPPPLRDLQAAYSWYLRAAEAGHAAAQNNLGAMHYDGRGALLNFVEAARWYRLAADQGHAVAQANLALMYGMGLGVVADPAAAKQWRERAKAVPDNARKNSDKPRGDQRVDPRRSRP